MGDVLVGFLGGMGLFFVGLKMTGDGVRALTGRRFRDLFLRWTRTRALGALLGYLAGLVFQSTSGLSLLLASLIGAGVASVSGALPVLLGANAGVASLVLMAVVDIKILVFVLLGLSGLVVAFERPVRLVRAGAIFFGVGLILLGLHTVRASAAPLAQEAWFQALMSSRDLPAPLYFLVGAAACLLLQTAAGVSILAITLVSSGVLPQDSALAIIYGSLLGSSALSRFYAVSLKGARKRLVMGQVCFNLAGLCLFVPPYLLETLSGVPLLQALAARIFASPAGQLTFLRVLFDSATAALLLCFVPAYNRLLERLCPDEEDSLAVLEYLKELPGVSPETALILANREQARLMRYLPSYLSRLRRALESGGALDVKGVHQAATGVLTAIDAGLGEIALNTATGEQANALAILRDNQSMIGAVAEVLQGIAVELSGARAATRLADLRDGVMESLDTLVLMLADAFESSEDEQWEILLELTRDKGPVMERMREKYLGQESGLNKDERQWLLGLTGQFERAVWLTRRLAKMQRRFLGETG